MVADCSQFPPNRHGTAGPQDSGPGCLAPHVAETQQNEQIGITGTLSSAAIDGIGCRISNRRVIRLLIADSVA